MMKRIGLVVLSMASGVLAASLPSEEMSGSAAASSAPSSVVKQHSYVS
jgi:hypothetical protein